MGIFFPLLLYFHYTLSMLEVSILRVHLALKVSDLERWYWLIFHIHCWLVRVS